MTKSNFTEITTTELDAVGGGTRTATSPSQDYQDRSMQTIEKELNGMQGGGSDMQLMMMIMQMLSRNKSSEVSQVCQPGLVGAIFGGTTTAK